jgi:hypothetical protein
MKSIAKFRTLQKTKFARKSIVEFRATRNADVIGIHEMLHISKEVKVKTKLIVEVLWSVEVHASDGIDHIDIRIISVKGTINWEITSDGLNDQDKTEIKAARGIRLYDRPYYAGETEINEWDVENGINIYRNAIKINQVKIDCSRRKMLIQ